MNFSKAEWAGLCVTAAMLVFFAGWYCRGVAGGSVYTVDAAPVASLQPSPTPSPSGPVDLNSATLEELQALAGVGPARAQAILDYREEKGPFARPQDITQVPGIGQSLYESLAGQITAGSPTDREGETG